MFFSCHRGLTLLKVDVGHPANPEVTETLESLLDSGATDSMVPAPILDRLGIRPLCVEELRLADGSRIPRRKGGARFRHQERVGVADVIFGEDGDHVLLGVLTLEGLGLSFDPIRRELTPLPLLLAAV